ncbi:hypothetical protein BDQ17DRAFT_1385030, partial [Cyathus striatus]
MNHGALSKLLGQAPPSRRKSWRSVQKRSRRSIEDVPGCVGSLSDGGEFKRMPRRPSSVPLPGDYGFGGSGIALPSPPSESNVHSSGTHQAHLILQYTTHSASEDQPISASSAPVISFSSLLPSPNCTSCSLGCASRWTRTHSPKKTHPSSTRDSSPASAFLLLSLIQCPTSLFDGSQSMGCEGGIGSMWRILMFMRKCKCHVCGFLFMVFLLFFYVPLCSSRFIDPILYAY